MNELIDDLITKKVSGQKLSDREEKALEDWLDADVRNKRYFFQLKLIYNQEDPAKLKTYREEVWGRLNGSSATLRNKKPVLQSILKWAAVLLVVSNLGWIFYTNYAHHSDELTAVNTINFIEKVSLPGQKITTTLPDGTKVKLNSSSKLLTPSRFVGNKREVILFGEAFFEVTRDESKPFIIKTADMSVQVLGTSFNVKAFADGSDQFVAVKTGKVSVQVSNGKKVELHPDQMVAINAKGNLSEITSFDSLYVLGWADQKLVFKDNTISEIFLKIEKWYDVEILSKDAVKSDELFTGVYQDATIKEVMISISKAFKFSYEIEGKIIRIKK